MPADDRIVIVEDDPIMGESLLTAIELERWHATWHRSARPALDDISGSAPVAVLCDMRLPDMSGAELFHRLCDRRPPPFIFMTAFGRIEEAVDLVRAGAEDYLTKPFEVGLLFDKLRSVAGRSALVGSSGTLGASRCMNDVEALLTKVANLRMPVLLRGETGTGKDVCARFLHARSDRAAEPFMAVNCAAIPAELMESEVFGHERGAFSGAHQRHVGYAERARRGTLFLDEVGDMPASLQTKLLRVVEDRAFHRVGGQAAVPLEARIVAATNRDLAAEVRAGRFREDLLYRLNVIEVELPPLRDRPDDVPWLLDKEFEVARRDVDPAPRGISLSGVQAALTHPWPGNARELRNRVARAVALAGGPWITAADLFPEKYRTSPVEPILLPLAEVRDEAERRQIEVALDRMSGSVGEVCRALGVSRTTLWEKMRRHKLADRARVDRGDTSAR